MPRNNFIPLSIVFVKDLTSKRYTAFFAEFPEVLAEGKDENDAEVNLLNTLQTVFEFKKTESKKEYILTDSVVTTKNFKLQMA